MYQSTCYPRDKEAIINLEFNGVLELLTLCLKHIVQSFSLSDSPREAIQDKATPKFSIDSQ